MHLFSAMNNLKNLSLLVVSAGFDMSRQSKSKTRKAVGKTLALVLAGGRGERLQSLTDSEAKPGLPFGGKFRLIDFPLSNCINSGIRRIGVATQYRAHSLLHHVQRTWGYLRHEMGEFVELWPAQQQTANGDWYAGTADAVFQNIHLILAHRSRYVLILAGDHVYKQDYRALIADHMERDAEVTVSCVEVPREDAHRFGVIEIGKNNEIVRFIEKSRSSPTLPDDPSRSLASMGIYLFNTDVLIDALREDAKKMPSRHDFGRDILPSLIGQRRLFAHRFSYSCVVSKETGDSYWRDVGTIDAYWEANMDLVRSHPPLDLYDSHWPIWSHQEQRPGGRVVDDGQAAGAILNSIISDGCVVSGGTVRRSVLFGNTHVGAASVVEDAVLLPGSHIGPRARVSRAILAPGCRVPPGLVIGENAEDDNRRFERSVGGITIVTPRMLARLKSPIRLLPSSNPIRLQPLQSMYHSAKITPLRTS